MRMQSADGIGLDFAFEAGVERFKADPCHCSAGVKTLLYGPVNWPPDGRLAQIGQIGRLHRRAFYVRWRASWGSLAG